MFPDEQITLDDSFVREYIAKNAPHIVIIGAQWHKKMVDTLVRNACTYCEDVGAEVSIVRVAGVMELPVAANAAIHNGAACVVVCGVVIRGDTPHFEYVCQGVTQGVTISSVATNTPIGFGVLTCDTVEQAEKRVSSKGREAVQAALHTLCQIAKMSETIGKDKKRSLGFK